MSSKKTEEYSHESIRVLKGLEPVKLRPGMYTRVENPMHIIQEVIDNAIDEAIGGFCDRVSVKANSDGSVTVSDNGRGIPVSIHPDEGVSTVEVVFTRLHSGGKFDKADGGVYRFAGGLHGVGVSVTNALSSRLEVVVTRGGSVHKIVFGGGDVVEDLCVVGRAVKDASGTMVSVWPDASYFDSPVIPERELMALLCSKAVLLPGLLVVYENEKTGQVTEWRYESGIKDYMEKSFSDSGVEVVGLVFCGERYFDGLDDTSLISKGEGAAWSIGWSEAGHAARESYVNLIPTSAGGTHEAGLKDGIFGAIKEFADAHNLLSKGVRLVPDDVMSRASYVLSAKILDPGFQGQTKERLTSREAVRVVSSMVKNPFEIWLNDNIESGKLIANLAIKQAQARIRSAQKVEKRKGSGLAVLPGKLTDCESTDVTRNELFLVEGDSAGGSAKQGRDKEIQALLPLRGKVLNTWDVDPDRLFANREIHDISVASGIDPHPGVGHDISNIRYGKIIIMSDADVDGSHIQVLLLTLFYKHFPSLVDKGHIYVAQPPLFRIDVPAGGRGAKKRPAQKIYCLDQSELDASIEKLAKNKISESECQISRFKGLGEMSSEQLWDTTMNPDTRRLVKVEMKSEADLIDTFVLLMGKGESSSRRTWLEDNGAAIRADI